MHLAMSAYVLLGVAAFPFVYYLLALFSSWRFFRNGTPSNRSPCGFAPPVSILKPVRGLDPDAYQNFASFCRQDYPDYEIIFCVGSTEGAVISALERLQKEFPERRIRILFGSGRVASNDKVAKLARLANEAQHEYLVISDSDVRVRPDYLRSIVAPLADPTLGAVTCFYVSTGEKTFAENLQTVGMLSDFYAGLLVARQIDGVKFALGPTIATTRKHLAGFGGYQKIENRPADDLLVGRLIAEQGYRVELLPYTVETVADYQSITELLEKRLRWLVVMRHMRPWGHAGLLFTQGLAWCVVAVAVHPSIATAFSFFGLYFALRVGMLWTIGAWGLQRTRIGWKDLPLILAWDGAAFAMWLISFARNTVRWRGGEYYIRDGMLVPSASHPSAS